MEKMADEIKKHSIKAKAITQWSQLYSSKKPFQNLFSIFIFIFLFSSSVALPFISRSYGHHISTFFLTNFSYNNDRHYIFLLCNGILVFLVMNSGSTGSSSPSTRTHPKVDQREITSQIINPPESVLLAMEPAAVQEKEEEKQIQPNGIWVSGVDDHNALSLTQDQIEDQKTQHILNVHDDQETAATREEEEEAATAAAEQAETAAAAEEFNQRCEEFIRKMRKRIKDEANHLPMVDFYQPKT